MATGNIEIGPLCTQIESIIECEEKVRDDMNKCLPKMAVIFWLASQSIACNCEPPLNLDSARSRNVLVFKGTLLEVRAVDSKQGDWGKWSKSLLTFAADTVYKGEIHDTVFVEYMKGWTSCHTVERTFNVGEEYEVGVDKPLVWALSSTKKGNNSINKINIDSTETHVPQLSNCSFFKMVKGEDRN